MLNLRRTLCVALVLLVSSSAAAAPGAPDVATQAAARKHVVDGKQALGQRQLLAALRHFRAAYRLWPRKENAFNLALVYHELGDKIAAANHLLVYLDQVDSKARSQLPKIFVRLLKKVGTLAVQAPGAQMEVWVDGRRAGTGRVDVALLPGRHVVQIRQGGESILEWKLVLERGQRLQWRPKVVSPSPRRARRLSDTRKPGDKGPPRPWGRLHWAYFAIAAGVAVAAGVAAIPLGLETNELEAEFKANPTDELGRRGKAYKNATNAMAGIAAIAGVSAVVLAIFTRWRPMESESRLTFSPAVRRGGATLTLRLVY